ncbi:MAG TPA: DUF192 domain-containing protein [Candidatus Elarobacter sp.]|jgi:hypothetical protein|nr:DUF192 domain-containing protein [Candidatus Elarobacter sp.]
MTPTPPTRKLLVLAVFAACTAQAPAPAASPLPWCSTVPLPQTDLSSLTFDDGAAIHHPRAQTCRALEVRAGARTLRLAVAATEAQREHGLMDVPFVPAGQGMLFAFSGGDAGRAFWMKNTIAPLDIVFVRGDGTISSIAANVPATKPGTPDDAVARRQGVARYVIELGAGEAAGDGLVQGMRLIIPPLPAE